MWTHANARCARVGVGARAGPSAARRVLAPASRGGPGADAARRRSASSSRRDRDPATRSTPADAPPSPPTAAARTRAVRSLSSAALAGAAALAVALAPSPPAWADDDAIGGVDAASSVAAAAAAAASESSEPEVVEFAFDDVEIGAAPDVAAQKARQTDLRARGLTELEAKAIENNQKIKQYNNAPDEFPTFVREGYDVKVITAPGFVTQDDGLVYKDFVEGTGAVPVDGQEVTFEYVAYNENGGTIDSTYRKGQPASTRLGINGMIPGFEEGLKGMREGGRRRVVVPPELGPPTGPATFFSAKQWEVFDIELVKIKNCQRVQSSFMSSSVVCE